MIETVAGRVSRVDLPPSLVPFINILETPRAGIYIPRIAVVERGEENVLTQKPISRTMRRGKTQRDIKSGAAANHSRNREARREQNRRIHGKGK